MSLTKPASLLGIRVLRGVAPVLHSLILVLLGSSQAVSWQPWPTLVYCSYLVAITRLFLLFVPLQLFDFIHTVKPDFSNFEESSSAWPYLLDEFVEHIREQRRQ